MRFNVYCFLVSTVMWLGSFFLFVKNPYSRLLALPVLICSKITHELFFEPLLKGTVADFGHLH